MWLTVFSGLSVSKIDFELASISNNRCSKIVYEYDQEIPQSQTADKPVVAWGRATQQSRDTRKTNLTKQRNQLSLFPI